MFEIPLGSATLAVPARSSGSAAMQRSGQSEDPQRGGCPRRILPAGAVGADWRFLNGIKRELKT
jgi:hypothetical protein